MGAERVAGLRCDSKYVGGPRRAARGPPAVCFVICRTDSAVAPDSVSGEPEDAVHPFSALRLCSTDSRIIKGFHQETVLATLLDVRIALGKDVGRCVRVNSPNFVFALSGMGGSEALSCGIIHDLRCSFCVHHAVIIYLRFN